MSIEKEDEFDCTEDKVCVSETAIIVNSLEIQDHIMPDKLKQDEVTSILNSMKIEFSSSEVQNNVIDYNVKMEEGNSVDLKMEFCNRLLYCEDCHAYCEEYCIECGMLSHILNKTASTDADNVTQELPNDILEVRYSFGRIGVFALKVIPKGVKFGPFTGLNKTECPWKIKGGKFAINDNKSNYLNWMQYINPAWSTSEQNLLVFQSEDNLYYLSTCKIQAGDELLVYFGEEYEDSLSKNLEVEFNPTTEPIVKDVFACTFCFLGFSSKTHLAKHKTICLKDTVGSFSIEELTQCPFCKIYLRQKEYFEHYMAYRCDRNIRKYMPPTPGNLTTEERTDITHRCQIYNFNHNLEGHVKTKHLVEFDYQCDSCQFRTNNKNHFDIHIKTNHLKECNFKCDICDYGTNLKSNLRRHTKTKHLKEFNYKCDSCEFGTNNKGYLEKHVKTVHLREFDYKCDLCTFKTNQKHHLEFHIKTTHFKERNYKCDSCEFRTNRNDHLECHIKTKHLEEFDFKCDSCVFKTNRKSQLVIHIKTKHLKEFNYNCNLCSYKADKMSSVEKHIKTIHLNEYGYKCDSCTFIANHKHLLERHIKTNHLKEFDYKCDTCEFKSNHKKSLERHTKAKHLERFLYKCDSCEFESKWKDNLERHMKTKHMKE